MMTTDQLIESDMWPTHLCLSDLDSFSRSFKVFLSETLLVSDRKSRLPVS